MVTCLPLAGAILLAYGCSTANLSNLQPESPIAKNFKIETVATNLEVPWALAWLPDGRILFTERPGRIRIIKNGVVDPNPVATLTGVISRGEGGLMDITCHPKFSENNLIYVSYVTQGSPAQVVVVRYKFLNNNVSEPKTIINGIAASMNHAGCRTRFGPDGKLYITTGERFQGYRAQDMNDLGGKTLRVNDDGSIPKDNPFINTPGARPEIWSLGHRNAQGIAWHPETGHMFQNEHGPSGSDGPGGGDEVNYVEKGKNYGWPNIHHKQTAPGMIAPLIEYTPAIAPGGATFCTGKMFPEWKNNFFITGLRGECVIRLTIVNDKIASQEKLIDGEYGRIREIAEAPDGSIWFTTSNRDGRGRIQQNDDKIYKIVKN